MGCLKNGDTSSAIAAYDDVAIVERLEQGLGETIGVDQAIGPIFGQDDRIMLAAGAAPMAPGFGGSGAARRYCRRGGVPKEIGQVGLNGTEK